MRSRLEPVADAARRGDPPRFVGVVLQLLAQPADVDGHGRRVLVLRRRVPTSASSWRRENTCRGERASVRGGRTPSASALTTVPSTCTSRRPGSMRSAVEVESPTSAADTVGLRPAQHGAHPDGQLARRERLDDVVVGAELESDHAIELLGPGRQQDDRDVARRRGAGAGSVSPSVPGSMMSSTTRSGRWSPQPLERRPIHRRPRGRAARRAGGTAARPRGPSARRRRRAPCAAVVAATLATVRPDPPGVANGGPASFASVSRFVHRRDRSAYRLSWRGRIARRTSEPPERPRPRPSTGLPSPASSRPASRSPSASSSAGSPGRGPSLVTAVGTQFIDRFAASLKDLAIALFGTNDKVALITGIVVVVGAARRPARHGLGPRPLVGVAGFVVFGVVGCVVPRRSAGRGRDRRRRRDLSPSAPAWRRWSGCCTCCAPDATAGAAAPAPGRRRGGCS